ncbi:MAG TPA: hypothetical protein PLO41_16185 [Rubrivivax sp.]|nr:hypothetical protein [Rubrivivax sp.]
MRSSCAEASALFLSRAGRRWPPRAEVEDALAQLINGYLKLA